MYRSLVSFATASFLTTWTLPAHAKLVGNATTPVVDLGYAHVPEATPVFAGTNVFYGVASTTPSRLLANSAGGLLKTSRFRITRHLLKSSNAESPIPPPSLSICLHQRSMPPLPGLRIPQSSRPANLRRRLPLLSPALRFRRLLLRPVSRRRHHPRPAQQRMEARPLHKSPFARRS
jgi:hypothetical protein